jgi:hypothetical protein
MSFSAGGRAVSLTDSQMRALGVSPGADRLGRGEDACVYACADGGVVKITRDAGDALACWLAAPQRPPWIVPVQAVWRIKGAYAIRAARVQELPREIADAIEALFADTDDTDEPWEDTHREVLREIEWQEAEHGGPTARDKIMRQALEAVNGAVLCLRGLKLDLVDYHSDNFGLHDGHPVLIDLGRLESLDGTPIEERAQAIPVLPY